MNSPMLLEALRELEREKGISVEESIDILEKALMSAYKNKTGERNVEIVINKLSGEIEAYQMLEVVDNVENESLQISLEDALKIKPDASIGDIVKKKMNIKKLGRFAVQVAKQVLIQKIREIEKEKQYERYSDLVKRVVTAEVLRVTPEFLDIRIGKLETHLPNKEWIPGETFEQSDLIKVYVRDVKRDKKGPKIIVSRIDPEFVLGLLELEVPEIENGIIEVVKVVREPGIRTKMAVVSHDPKIDPVGSCIGHEGSRIASVLKELRAKNLM